MKLYRAKIPVIAKSILDRLVTDGDIEIGSEKVSNLDRDVATRERRVKELDDQMAQAAGKGQDQVGELTRLKAELADAQTKLAAARKENRADAEKDLAAIMDEYLRRDNELRDRIRDQMADENIPYSDFGRTRKRIADELGHPLGDDVERFLVRQFIENMMISPSIEEVYGEDREIYKKVMEVLKSNDVNEDEIRAEAIGRMKNVREGTVEFELQLQEQMKAVKERRGLIEPRKR